jgi:hypothetical protein
MSHFYGTLQGGRGRATRCGTKKSGLDTRAASWGGCISVDLYHDEKTGEDCFTVYQTQHPSNGAGIRETIAEGVIGQPTKKENGKAELLEMSARYEKEKAGLLVLLQAAEDARDEMARRIKKAEG